MVAGLGSRHPLCADVSATFQALCFPCGHRVISAHISRLVPGSPFQSRSLRRCAALSSEVWLWSLKMCGVDTVCDHNSGRHPVSKPSCKQGLFWCGHHDGQGEAFDERLKTGGYRGADQEEAVRGRLLSQCLGPAGFMKPVQCDILCMCVCD